MGCFGDAVPRWIDLGINTLTTANGINFLSSNATVSSFSPFNLASSNPANPLPVSLIEFDAVYTGKVVVLNWQTYSLSPGARYIIERSSDGIEFTPIGYLNEIEALTWTGHYSYEDVSAFYGRHYYRLQINNADNHSTYSKVVVVNVIPASEEFIVFPSPVRAGASATIQLSSVGNQSGTAALFTTNDQKVNEMPVYINKSGMARLPLPAFLAPGLYQLVVQIEAKRYHAKIAIQ